LIGRLLRKLLFTLALVAGADLVLFAALDSGAFGDAALLQMGPKASTTDIGYARVRLGYLDRFEPTAIKLRLMSSNPKQRLRMQVSGQELHLLAANGDLLRQASLAGTVTDVANTMVAWSGEGWQMQAFTSVDARDLPAAGLATALDGLVVRLRAAEPATLSWARAKPFGTRFLNGFLALLRFDFGYDRNGRAVAEQLSDRGGRSLMLSVPAFILSTALAIFMAFSAVRRRPGWDKRLQLLATLVMSTSSLAWIFFLRQWFAIDLGWFPLRPWSEPLLPLLLLPILIWVFLSVWPDFLLYRSIVSERAGEGWLQAARARGISPQRLCWKHMLPNLAAPIASLLAVTLPFLILGSLLLERVFDIPGLGGSLIEAVEQHDTNILRALTFLFALGYLFAQWIGDVIAAVCDPRLRRPSA
jgi:peptide/nickel transport system permease protein